MVILAAPYNETLVLETINHQAFYNSNLGPFLAGLAVQMFMMGVLSLQCWTYFSDGMAANDTRWHKSLVGVMFATGAFQTGTNFDILYDTFVSGYGRIEHWDKYNWTFTYEPGFTASIALIAQVFFIHRCFVVSRSFVLVAFSGTAAAVAFGAGIAVSVGAAEVKYYTRVDLVLVQVTIWLVATATTDLLISAALIVKLRNARTSFRSKERMLSRMIRVTFETATLTSLIAIVDLIFYAGFGKGNSVHLFFQFIIGKMYSHSVMVTLLSRKRIRQAGSDGINVVSNSGEHPTHGVNGQSDHKSGHGAVSGVNVTTTCVTVTDPVQKKGHRAIRPFKVNHVDGSDDKLDEYPLGPIDSLQREQRDKSMSLV
ncbi:hypothetical protein BDV98DRAFT_574472 [Pterulicium gracile]|uniref:DUF6534 domain-containing protein n=1 Tax=Pterulicium gracile TaxID=1884261 RepID=A0A5C3QB86_9AGAR|nr:hypothetical protein BDV98DRAFT_574472 [Pterula gracilis]